MALAERAELVARLSLKDDFSGKAGKIQKTMGGIGASAKRAGKAISVGLGAGLAQGNVLGWPDRVERAVAQLYVGPPVGR